MFVLYPGNRELSTKNKKKYCCIEETIQQYFCMSKINPRPASEQR